MTATLERGVDDATTGLAEELHELEAHEAALERRTRSLEFAGPLSLIFSLFALALGAGALVVALNKDHDTTGTSAATGGVAASTGSGGGTQPASMMSSGGTSSSGMMMGAGGHGRFTSMQMAAAKHGTIYVQLGDFWAGPTVSVTRPGKVTFVARNVGKVPHELMVERMPMKFESPMSPDENAAQGMIADMQPGHTGRMTMRLRAGKYMLFCNLPGHYASGQHMVFTVKA